MKKLVTAFAACLTAGLVSAAVESQNIVGYMTAPTTGSYKIGIPAFQKVGGGATIINDLVNTNLLAAYVDEVQTYDPVSGSFSSWTWDGTGWTDYSVYTNITVTTGQGYVMNLSQDTVFAGQVAGGTTLAYTHTLPTGYSIWGSAFPVALKTSNLNTGSAFAGLDYQLEVQIYNPVAGSYVTWTWDGTGWTDFATNYLPNELAPQGQGVMFGNNSGAPLAIVETL